MTRFRTLILVAAFAVGLTVLFWQPLWTGGGLIGGDTYTYYLPQKTFYADRLQAGEFPLWNNRVGHGYPVLGESQTGACYPFYLLAYSTLDVNTAYNAVHLLHYMMAFLFTWMYARRLGLGTMAALLAGVVFTYGWFPSRSCWEWAIVTGAYLPLALWCVESFLRSVRWRYLIALSVAIGLQLLAGHYNLAFITQLVLVAYIPLRLWFADDRLAETVKRRRVKVAAACGVSLLLGFAIAAVQLFPTWELKQQSQRAVVGGPAERETETGYDLGYGHLPPVYFMQLATPWDWYPLAATGELDGVLSRLKTGAIESGTNQIEAHLYFGLVPLSLVLGGGVFWLARRRRRETRFFQKTGLLATGPSQRLLWVWAIFGFAAVVYATGWLLPVTRHLPGFSFFGGPGRYGIIATLSAAVIAAAVFDRLLMATQRQRFVTACLVAAVFAGTIYDLHWAGQLVTNAYQVERPPILARERSQITRTLAESDQPVRLVAPGANLPTLTGVAATPVYLGIGPAAYFDAELRMPSLSPGEDDGKTMRAAEGQIDWLQRAGVTHVLSFKPLEPDDWPVELVYSGPDSMLNSAWGRSPYEPLYLNRLNGSRGRVAFAGTARVVDFSSNRVVIEANSRSGGPLILTDLMYPGWNVRIDGQPAEAITHEPMYRAVDLPPGKHQVIWSYQPATVCWGAAISLVALLLLAAIAHIRYWRPRMLAIFDPEPAT
ncbi:MAG: hypothetical protein HOL01_03740 [Planctomycetaceae bacterium]|nr:hypothetical protein [Planctomycetaceae bacterium]